MEPENHPFAKEWKSGRISHSSPPNLRLWMVLRHWSLNSCIAQKCQAGTEGAGNHSDIQTQRSYAHLKIYAKLMEQIRRSPLGMYKTLWTWDLLGIDRCRVSSINSPCFSTKESMRSSGTFLLWDKNHCCLRKKILGEQIVWWKHGLHAVIPRCFKMPMANLFLHMTNRLTQKFIRDSECTETVWC